MKIPTKKLTNGFEMPVLGFGTWTIGGKLEAEYSHDKEDIEAIKNTLTAGIYHIDTAERYGNGHAEELVGKAIRGFDRRKLFITSKVAPYHLHYSDVVTACEASLQRLQTDYLDLYLIHAPNDEVPITETLRAFDELLQRGLIKAIGVSNFTTKRLQEAQKHTRNKIVTNQVLYNLLYRQVEQDRLLIYCQKNDIFLTAFRPVERGILTQSKDVVDNLCSKYGKTPAQIAINWLVSQKSVVTIAKMSNPEHLNENLVAIDWKMENEDIEELRIIYPMHHTTSDTPLR